MELQLVKELEHQQKAVDAIRRVFENVNIEQPALYYENPKIDICSSVISDNITEIQKEQNIPFELRHNKLPGSNGILTLDIKMETGTGKTYVYAKVMYELNRQYGINKFIIVVPGNTIKAGTSRFLQDGYVQQHFADACGYGMDIEVGVLEAVKSGGKNKRRYFPGVISEFVTGTCQNTKKIHVLLTNMQLLTSAMLRSDGYDGGVAGFYRPLDALMATKPFVIIDEPHRFERFKNETYKVIADQIRPQCVIRFGATFPEITEGTGKNKRTRKDYENLLYDLDACASFNMGLIKGVAKEHFESLSGKDEKVKILATVKGTSVTLQKRNKDGAKTFTLGKGDSLALISEDLTGITVDAIRAHKVEFSNGIEKSVGEEIDVNIYMDSYQEQMLKLAIERHFETERENFNRAFKIKTLALFFIDDIASYRTGVNSYRTGVNGKTPYLREAFERLLREALERELKNSDGLGKEYKEYLEASLRDVSACHAGYFSQDNNTDSDEVAREVNIILYGKTELLAFKKEDGSYNTLRFLFSKWTLKEGWDNPNVFTIAKLRSSGSEISKLQEVGRGLRLPVNEQGCRVANESFTLNYIVDFTEANFAKKLVEEINGSRSQSLTVISDKLLQSVASKLGQEPALLFGKLLESKYIDRHGTILESEREQFLTEYPEFVALSLQEGKIIDRNTTNPARIAVRPQQFDKLKDLWEKFNRRYLLFFDNELNRMIDDAISAVLETQSVFGDVMVGSKRSKIVKNTEDNSVRLVESAGKSYVAARHLPYGIFLKKLSRITSIPVTQLHSGLCRYAKQHPDVDINKNCTEQTIARFNQNFMAWKDRNLLKRFYYKKSDDKVVKTALTNTNGTPVAYIAQGRVGTKIVPGESSRKYLYDSVAYDSDLEKDNILTEIEGVTVYGKIPRGSLAIPSVTGGTYSPDFMYVVKRQGSDKPELNVIIETKDYEDETQLSAEEKVKIRCAEVFFENLKAEGLNVRFCSQLRHQDMAGIIRDCLQDNDQQKEQS